MEWHGRHVIEPGQDARVFNEHDMRDFGRIAVSLLFGALVLAGSAAWASENYHCRTQHIRDCQPTGCTELAEAADIALDVSGRTFTICIKGLCRNGALDAWDGKPDDVQKGIVGFSQPDKVNGLTGMADLDRGEFVMIDGTRYLLGRCAAK